MRSFWAESAVPDPPPPMRRDLLLVALVVPLAIGEGVLRTDLVWPAPSIAVCLVLAAILPFRRTHPLLAVVAFFVSVESIAVAALLADVEWEGLYTAAFTLLLPYSLFRWASGRHRVYGLIVMEIAAAFSATDVPVGEAIAGGLFLMIPAFLGGMVRYERDTRHREVEQVKSFEREQLARELHDTVAHHVSAIAIQAQAGRATAPSRPEAALEALEIIEEEASRTLAEMRAMVGALRTGEEPELAPQPGIREIRRLADLSNGPEVRIALTGDHAAVGSPLDAAVYRLAQESVTNAIRHARRATCIDVRVDVDDEFVRVTVDDDGETPGAASTGGFGLLGMKERAAILGGSLDAGPKPGRGWSVTALLPRDGAPT